MRVNNQNINLSQMINEESKLIQALKMGANQKRTENGAFAYNSTNSDVYNLFAFGGAYRTRSDEDVVNLFKKAYTEDAELALKCLFYLRDCRGGGQGERRFFRVAYKWLCNNHPKIAAKFLTEIPNFGRWDDLLYITYETPCFKQAMDIVYEQIFLDLRCQTPSLLAKWLPSENASSEKTRSIAKVIRKELARRDPSPFTAKTYRQMLSILRKRINIVESLMSSNQWDKIEFDKIPSKAGLIYKNAFARRDIISKKYETFAKDENTKVNANTLYPYEIVDKALKAESATDRAIINKYWKNLPDYFEGKPASMICMVDTSGSMWGQPINVAISLGLYCAERLRGPFANHYISFASRPQLIPTNDEPDFCSQVRAIEDRNLCDNTNLEAAFELLLHTAQRYNLSQEMMPETIVVISDMEIDQGACSYSFKVSRWTSWTKANISTEMEKMRGRWASAGYKLPRLIYWNVNARQNTILDAGPMVSYVSGCSPVIFKSVLTGKNGYSLMLDIITNKRYDSITLD